MKKENKIVNRLPVTRKALFKDILRNRWRTLLECSLLMLVFLLPIIVSSTFKDYMILNLLNDSQYYSGGVFTDAGMIKYKSISFIFLLINSFCILILFIYFCGVFRIYRQLIWSEGISFWSDFKKGISQNVWIFMRYGLLISILYFATWSLLYFANNLIFTFISLGIATFVFIPLVVVGMYYSVIYNSTFRQRINNVVLLYLKNALIILLLSIIFEAFFLVELIPSIYVIIKQVILLLLTFFILPLLILIGSLITIHIFDKDINFYNHKDIYKKGLY